LSDDRAPSQPATAPREVSTEVPNQMESHGSQPADVGETSGAHEGSILAHPHPTVLNAYPIVLEAFAGRFTDEERSAGFRERLSIAAVRASHGSLSPTPQAVLQWVDVNTVASWLVIGVLLLLIRVGTRRLQTVPSGLQNIWEWTYETLYGFTATMIGEQHAPTFMPLLATFFLYIFVLNLGGLVPGFVSPTAALNTTIALALCCFLAVQYHGFRQSGVRYLMHFVGDPWWLFPINIPIHLLGELARPLSLSVRLFGNIFGEDTVIAQLVTMGVIALGVRGLWLPVPVQFPMLLFGIFGSFVQALVFTMLAASYVAGVVEEHGNGSSDH
jgi:F-type H+-transporting ATPase subunit a